MGENGEMRLCYSLKTRQAGSILLIEVIVLDNKSDHKEETIQPKVPTRFHERFNIEVNLEDTKKRFINRIINLLEVGFPYVEFGGIDVNTTIYSDERREIAIALGTKFRWDRRFSDYVEDDFLKCLLALEALYQALVRPSEQEKLNKLLEYALSQSETDLGVRWRTGIFLPSGAKLLDEALVNEPLQWLSAPKYHNVLAPFQNGLSDFLEANKRPEGLADTIIDMYEALEAMAKVVTGRPKRDLSGNAELFVKKLGLSDYYKKMLKDYISYANEFRHAVEEGEERVPPLPQEVEAFIYTTGLFIRLAVKSLLQSSA